VFGCGAGLCIEDKNSRNKSFCSFIGDDYTYEMPPGCNSHEEATKYFAGSEEFTIKEIEVFRVSFK
jgi:hypothetical protein